MEQIHPEYIKASRRIILRGQTTPQTRSERTQGLSYDDLELCTQCSQFDRPASSMPTPTPNTLRGVGCGKV